MICYQFVIIALLKFSVFAIIINSVETFTVTFAVTFTLPLSVKV